MPEFIAVFDVGTSATKAVLVDRERHVVHENGAPYPTYYPAPGYVEQSPDHWWEAVCSLARGFWQAGWRPEEVVAVGLTGQMQDLILVDATLHALGNALLYADARAVMESATLQARLAKQGVPKGETTYLDPTAPLSKLIWLRTHEPERLSRCATLLFGAKDYILARLAGIVAGDATTAATTGMFSQVQHAWQEEWLDLFDFPRAWLPPLLPVDRPAGQIAEEASRLTGFQSGTPVFPGVGDAAAATMSAGLTRPDHTYIYLGTTAWIAALARGPVQETHGIRWLPYVLPDLSIKVAPLLNAGSAQQWIMEVLGLRHADANGSLHSDHAAFEDLLRQTAGRSGGALFLPYLQGERSPVQESRPMGAFAGLGAGSGRGELAWAVLEGIGFSLRQLLEVLDAAAPSVRLLGGVAESAMVPQLIADVCDLTVHIPLLPSAAGAVAAAAPVAAGLGWFSSIAEAIDSWMPATGKGARVAAPSGAWVEHYSAQYARYVQLYPLLRQLR